MMMKMKIIRKKKEEEEKKSMMKVRERQVNEFYLDMSR
jgi:hypothetical protein